MIGVYATLVSYEYMGQHWIYCMPIPQRYSEDRVHSPFCSRLIISHIVSLTARPDLQLLPSHLFQWKLKHNDTAKIQRMSNLKVDIRHSVLQMPLSREHKSNVSTARLGWILRSCGNVTWAPWASVLQQPHRGLPANLCFNETAILNCYSCNGAYTKGKDC